MNKVVDKVVNIGMWVVLIGSVVHLISSDGPVNYALVAVAFGMVAALFTDSQKKRSGDKKPLTKEESAKAIEAEIRKFVKKPRGELTKAGLEKVTVLDVAENQLTEVKGLEKLTKLTNLNLRNNKLTSVKGLEKLTQLRQLLLDNNKLTKLPKGLEKLTQLKMLWLNGNPDLTKAQIDELQKGCQSAKSTATPGSNPSTSTLEQAWREA